MSTFIDYICQNIVLYKKESNQFKKRTMHLQNRTYGTALAMQRVMIFY